MHSLAKLALHAAAGVLVAFSLGCSDSEGGGQNAGGTGGSITASESGDLGGQSATSAAAGSAGSSAGGVSAVDSSSSAGATATAGRSSEAGGTSATSTSSPTGDGGATGGRTGGRSTTGGRTSDGGRTGGRTSEGGTSSAGGTTGVSSSSAPPSTGTPPSTGKKWFGNIDTGGSIRSDFKNYWDQFSPENAGKWGSVQGGGQSSFNWNALDNMYKYCNDNNILFKEHTFIWGAQQPSWVNNSNGEAAVKAWMKAFCTRYPKVAIIDVVNEPLHPKPSYRDGIGGSGASGWDWIVNALKWAKEACPNAILVVNDYNTIEYSGENGNIIKLANAVKNAGGPIDAIGCQAHDIAKVSSATLKSYSEKIIAETGLPLHITEMDIGEADDNKQAQMMRDFVTPAWENPKILGFTYWGYIVGRTWRANTGLMTDSSKRPAMTWLMSFLKR